jgi:Leucine-rich repeat (LRR) protein
MMEGDAVSFQADAEIYRLLHSTHPENVRLALVLAQNPALRLRDLSQLVALALLHPELEFREMAIAALESQGLHDIRAVIRHYWQRTHPAGKPAVLYASLRSIERALRLKAGALQTYLASRLQVWPEGVAHRFPAAFLAWCRTNLDEDGALHLPETLPRLPNALLQVEGLRHLELKGNRLRELPDWLGELQGLQSMTLSRSAISALPDSLRHWSTLESLSLDCPRLSHFPAMLADCGRLQHLKFQRIDNAALQGLPDMPQLVHLGIRNAQGLTALPDDFDRLSGLRRLHIDRTRLQELPPSLGRLAQLEELVITSGPLQRMPAELAVLRSLKHLHLEFVLGEDLPDLSGLAVLQDMTLRCPELRVWPQSWCVLPELFQVYVRGCLTKLPEEFSQLALMVLHLDHNPLQEFPAALLRMQTLTDLSLTHTGITELPDGLRALTQLQRLALAHNGMRQVPQVLFEMTGLHLLDLRNNHLPLPEVEALRAALPDTIILTA